MYQSLTIFKDFLPSLYVSLTLFAVILKNASRHTDVAKDGGTRGGISWWHLISVQKYVKNKKKFFAAKSVGFRSKWTKQSEKERYSPQISGVMVSYHNAVLPQNSDTRGAPPFATPLSRRVVFFNC